MDTDAARLQARMKWEAACERLRFALQPHPDMAREGAPNLEEAVTLAQSALEEIRTAYGDGRAGPGAH
ncbi:MAG: hypothetical protein EOP82_11390 [Variovorax sp.]|nr:MAG: hypothetical protein EOP82_11390 [Variovorax sp.]